MTLASCSVLSSVRSQETARDPNTAEAPHVPRANQLFWHNSVLEAITQIEGSLV